MNLNNIIRGLFLGQILLSFLSLAFISTNHNTILLIISTCVIFSGLIGCAINKQNNSTLAFIMFNVMNFFSFILGALNSVFSLLELIEKHNENGTPVSPGLSADGRIMCGIAQLIMAVNAMYLSPNIYYRKVSFDGIPSLDENNELPNVEQGERSTRITDKPPEYQEIVNQIEDASGLPSYVEAVNSKYVEKVSYQVLALV